MAQQDRTRSKDTTDRWSQLASIIFAGSTLVTVLLSLIERSSIAIPAVSLAAIGAALAVVAGSVYLFLVLRRTRYLSLRAALTGAPGVGKTVFANLVFDRLMTNSAQEASFTADTSTAISVYQVIRGIDQSTWPASTLESEVYKYLGKLKFDTSPRATVVDLEIGDSAGEHWIDLAESSRPSGSQRRSPYLEYVISSSAVVHVIEAQALVDDRVGGRLRREIRDLQVASQLMRATGGRTATSSLLVVLSKADLLLAEIPPLPHFEGLLELIVGAFRDARIFSPEALLREAEQASGGNYEVANIVPGLLPVCEMAEALRGTFGSVDLMLSSVFDRGGKGAPTVVPGSAGELLGWLRMAALRASGPQRRKSGSHTIASP